MDKITAITWIHLVLSIIGLNLIAWFIPKKLTRVEIYSTTLFSYGLEYTVDSILNLHYHLYGYFHEGFEYVGLLPIFFIYPAVNIIFLNFFPYHRGVLSKTVNIIGWSIFSVAYEYSAVSVGWFYYNHWTLWYSGLCYPPLFLILLLNLKFTNFLEKRPV
ncbi:CBO0543 family protein [Paenibacillus cremeus]|uniref:Uncharacterized protein n=1 Tax=Paenibacillus cremeus TaxID=2163881 RepID=A0A559KI21_9BACL|nr:CBO0543 family protein [Paenibacillus cremeus]TVY11783.1 hypothetical protein FPZ49_00355 [Paenibacillus cremeus]